MDTLRLLSRGTRSSRTQPHASRQRVVPSAETSKPQLFVDDRPRKKRKLNLDNEEHLEPHDLSSASTNKVTDSESHGDTSIPFAERKSLLKQHKIKTAWLKSNQKEKKSRKAQHLSQAKADRVVLYPDPLLSLKHLDERINAPTWLSKNVSNQGYHQTTEVQMAAVPCLLSLDKCHSDGEKVPHQATWPNLLTVAPTGSGKTLAFLIPALASISTIRNKSEEKGRCTRVLILAPTKELVGQIVNEGKALMQGSGLKISTFRKDMRLAGQSVHETNDDARTVARPDILVSTPGMLHIAITKAEDEADMLADVQYLILDEADVLLDPLFREQTVGIWNQLSNTQLRVTLWSATMGSNIEDLARSIIQERSKRLKIESDIPLIRLVVGLKDSAVPNVQHKLIYAATEQGKLMALRQLLHPATSSSDSGSSLRPPFIVFTQTIERAIALHSELRYDIPAEAGGISRIAVLHSDLSDAARDNVMTRFRKGEIWVLITTDLLSRGIDFRGVNGVVNYDIPSSSAAYVHRAGRTGRAGREGGVAVTLYSKEDIPYIKHVANVIAAAQKAGASPEDSNIQQWLLDALPTLSRNDKQRFKKHGVESRTAKGMSKDPKAARKARISTKSGYLKREENKRRGAIESSRRRTLADVDDVQSASDFGGFD